jgi:uncharacterized membrane protein YeiB
VISRGPAEVSERAPAPDLARGFMLLLIALANTPYYLWSGHFGTATAHPLDGSAADRVAQVMIITMVDFRTYPMFAFLFGYGMVQLYNSQVAAGTAEKPARRLLQRRNAWLLIFGFVHAALLWMGDVLGAYGLAGLILVAIFFRRKSRTILIWAAILVGLLVVSMILSIIGAFLAAQEPAPPGTFNFMAGSHAAMANESYLGSIPQRLAFWAFLVIGQGLLMLVIPVMLLLAFWAGRRQILERPGEHLRLLRLMAAIGIPIGWLGGIPSALNQLGVIHVPDHVSWVMYPIQAATGLFTGLGYVALFGLIGHRISQRGSSGFVASAVTAVGRRSLSCYLAQSVLCAPILAAWGLGLGAHLGSATMALYAIAVWLVTIGFAVWLERTGRKGPAEVLLRRLVYRRAQRS